jgi:drug/metabolite transporter (DMT)-like permease
MPKQPSDKLLVLAIVLSMFLWGLSWPSGKVLTHYCSAINFSVYRYTLVVATLLVLLLASRTQITIQKKGMPVVLAAGVCLCGYSYLFFMGLKNGAPGAGGILVTILNPIMAYTLGIILDRKLPKRNEAIGLLLGIIAGCILLKVWDNGHAIIESGNIYFLLAALTWAVMSKFTSKGSRYGTSAGFSLWQYIITLACFLPMMDTQEFVNALGIKDSIFWGNLLYSSVINTALATTMYFYATTRLGAEKASSFIFLVPMAAGTSSWLLLGEHIAPHTIIGGVVGIAAVYMINVRKTRA